MNGVPIVKRPMSASAHALELTGESEFSELRGVQYVYVDPEQAAKVGDLAILDLPDGAYLQRVENEDDLKHVTGRVTGCLSLTDARRRELAAPAEQPAHV